MVWFLSRHSVLAILRLIPDSTPNTVAEVAERTAIIISVTAVAELSGFVLFDLSNIRNEA